MKLNEITKPSFDNKTMTFLKPIYYVAKDDMDADGADDYLRRMAGALLWGVDADDLETKVEENDGDLSKWIYRKKGSTYKLVQDGDDIEDRPDGAMWDVKDLEDMIKQKVISISITEATETSMGDFIITKYEMGKITYKEALKELKDANEMHYELELFAAKDAKEGGN